MAQTLTDRRDVQFVLYEQLDTESLTKGQKFSDLNKKVFEMVLSEARLLATKELLPISEEGDTEGCTFENGSVKIIESFHRAYELMKKGEWIAIPDDPEVGGQGMPLTITTAVMEMFHAANLAMAGFTMLTHGSGKLVEVFGTDKQKELYLEKMYSGEWGGTMCLTEPGAGSDVGALTTSAVKNEDGTYSISGNKIFISGGEHDLVDNIIHPVLARIEGAPKGPFGISLFLAPKIRVNDDGSLGEPNDIVCTGIEEKIGLHSCPTCSLTFGGKDKCIGTLLGEENQGLKTMFHMMNEERLNVAMQSQGLASTSFLCAVNYARERLQGKHITKSMDPDAPQIPIIEHPDVRRMLIWMKSLVEGMRSLNYFVAYCMDKVEISESDEEKESLNGLIAFLTPLCKAYTTERACEVIAMAMQVHGGYGACKEYSIEQMLRDNKITTIYEGTTGIQAMDLLGRKIGMKKGKVLKDLLMRIMECVNNAKSVPELGDIASTLEKTTDKFGETALKLGKSAASPKVLEAFAQACPFLDCTSEVVLGWMHLWRATIASKALTKILKDADDNKKKEMLEKNKDAAFYHGQIQTARYFINSILPVTSGRMDAVVIQESAPITMTDAAFGA